MADIVIETGKGSAALVIAGTLRNNRAADYPAEQNPPALPLPSDSLLGTIEDTVSISLKARNSQRDFSFPTPPTLPAADLNQTLTAAGANPFLRSYEQSYRLRFFDDRFDSDSFTGDRIDISEEALKIMQAES